MRIGDVVFRRRSNCKSTDVVPIRFLDELIPLASSVAKTATHNPWTQACEIESCIWRAVCSVTKGCSKLNSGEILPRRAVAAVKESHGIVQRNDALKATPCLAHSLNVLCPSVKPACHVIHKKKMRCPTRALTCSVPCLHSAIRGARKGWARVIFLARTSSNTRPLFHSTNHNLDCEAQPPAAQTCHCDLSSLFIQLLREHRLT